MFRSERPNKRADGLSETVLDSSPNQDLARTSGSLKCAQELEKIPSIRKVPLEVHSRRRTAARTAVRTVSRPLAGRFPGCFRTV